MKIRHNPAGQRQQIQEFFDSSRRMLHAPRQTLRQGVQLGRFGSRAE